MSYTYLDLVNEVLTDFNEVNLTSTTFASATGFHSLIKFKVNAAIQDIYQEEDGKWPFARQLQNNSLTVPVAIPNIIEYSINGLVAVVDWESFYLKRDSTKNQSDLAFMDYNEYKRDRKTIDANMDSSAFGQPSHVVRLQNNTFTVTPVPNYAWTVEYEAFMYPTELTLYTDVPTIPEAYKQVILDKTMEYGYMFRDNVEQAAKVETKYKDGVERMRRALIPQSPHMVDRN